MEKKISTSATALWSKLKDKAHALTGVKPNFAALILTLGGVVLFGYVLTFFFTVTDNAFVVKVETPIASKVIGTVEEVLVTNGQYVKAGDPLVRLEQDTYQLAYDSAEALYKKADLGIEAVGKAVDQATHALSAAQANLDIIQNEFDQRNHPSVRGGIPQIEMTELSRKIEAQQHVVAGLADQLEIEKLELAMERAGIVALRSARDQAKIALDDTVIRAEADGQVQNVFLGVGKHLAPGEALFTLVTTDKVFVQANFEETDLAGVKAGDAASIYPRMYLGSKSFAGKVLSGPFGVSRRISQPFTGNPIVMTENKWLLLPQRLPVIIEVTDPDPNYPLESGMSAYVRIKSQ